MFARQNEQRLLFRDDGDHRRYLAMLAGVVGRFGWRCLAYCLMPNHVHLLIETPKPNLGRGMQRLHGDYGRWFADRRGRGGAVFQGRFGTTRVTDDDQLWTAAGYVAANPVAAGLCPTPEAWRWSSHAATSGLAPAPSWLDDRRLLELLSGTTGRRSRASYAAFVAARLAEAAA